MPYAEDPSKRSRYRSYLETQASLLPKGTLPERAHGASNEDWAKEMQEFAHAARIFKPMTGSMAARFTTSSSSAPKAGTGDSSGTGDVPLLTKPADNKPAKTSAEEAAAAGMYGHLTRSTTNWYPTRLLCKRFNVKPPEHVVVDPGDGPDGEKQYSSALPQKRLELVGKRDMDELRMGSAGGAGMGARNSGFMSGGVQEGSEPAMEGQTGEEGGGVVMALLGVFVQPLIPSGTRRWKRRGREKPSSRRSLGAKAVVTMMASRTFGCPKIYNGNPHLPC